MTAARSPARRTRVRSAGGGAVTVRAGRAADGPPCPCRSLRPPAGPLGPPCPRCGSERPCVAAAAPPPAISPSAVRRSMEWTSYSIGGGKRRDGRWCRDRGTVPGDRFCAGRDRSGLWGVQAQPPNCTGAFAATMARQGLRPTADAVGERAGQRPRASCGGASPVTTTTGRAPRPPACTGRPRPPPPPSRGGTPTARTPPDVARRVGCVRCGSSLSNRTGLGF